MKKWYKVVTSILLAGCIVLGTVGCNIVVTDDGDNSGNGGQGATKPGGYGNTAIKEDPIEGKLTVQVFVNENGTGEKAWQAVLDAFEEANPDLELTTFVGPNVNTQLSNKWSSGKGTPDVVLIDGKGLSEYAMSSAGSFMDLSSWYEEATVYGTTTKISSIMNEKLVEKIDGKLYKMPIMSNCYGLWYSDTYYNENGLTIHNNYDKLMSNGESIKKKDGFSLIYPGQYANYLVWGMIMPAVASYGQEFFDSVSSAEDPDIYKDDRFKAVLTNFKAFADAGYIINGTATLDHISAQTSWLNNNAALISTGVWVEQEMKTYIPGDFNMKFTVAGLNGKDQTPTAVMSGVGVAISSTTKNEENAKTFLRYLYQEQVLANFATDYGYMSACNDIAIDTEQYTKVAKATFDYLTSEGVNQVYKTYNWGNVGEEFNNVVNAMALGKCTVDEACDRLVKAAKQN